MTTAGKSGQLRSGQSRRSSTEKKVASPLGSAEQEAPHDQSCWNIPTRANRQNGLLWPGEEQAPPEQLPVRLSDQNLRNPHAPSQCGVVALPSVELER